MSPVLTSRTATSRTAAVLVIAAATFACQSARAQPPFFRAKGAPQPGAPAAPVVLPVHQQFPAGPAGPGGLTSGPSIPLDVERFAENIKQAMEGKCVGYNFAIYKDGKLAKYGYGGLARTGADAPAKSYSIQTRTDIGSCSKLICAIAVIDELHRQGKTLDEPIHTYVPADWPQHPSMKTVTFRQLMAHRSGIQKTSENDVGSSTPGEVHLKVKAAFAQGVVDSSKAYNYENFNYSILDNLLPYLYNRESMEQAEDDPVQFDLLSAFIFNGRVQERVLKRAGLPTQMMAKDWHQPGDGNHPYAMNYDFANPGEPGAANNDNTLGCGPGGWTMNPVEHAALLSALWRNKLLAPEMLEEMKSSRLGMFQETGKYGTYYHHNGATSGSKGSVAQFVLFPNNVQVSLLSNSKGNTHGDKKALLIKAFEDACRSPDLVVEKVEPYGKVEYRGGEIVAPVVVYVKNRGTAATGTHFFAGAKQAETVRWTTQWDRLAAGEMTREQAVVRIPDPQRKHAGKTIPIDFVADLRLVAGDTSVPDWAFIKESNESNNGKRFLVQVPADPPSGLAVPEREPPRRVIRPAVTGLVPDRDPPPRFVRPAVTGKVQEAESDASESDKPARRPARIGRLLTGPERSRRPADR